MKILFFLPLLAIIALQKSFASCSTSTLNIANATYNANTEVLAGYSITINCKSGYLNPEEQPSFDINCNNNVKIRDDGTIYKKDEWFFLENVHVCTDVSTPPSSKSSISLNCFTKDLYVPNGTVNTTATRIASGSYVNVTCNSGYAASSMSLNSDQTPKITTYVPKTNFNVMCLDGKFLQFTGCLTTCDINEFRLRLQSVIPTGQTINSTSSIAAPNDFITINCGSGGIPQTGLTGYKAYCVLDENCKSIDSTAPVSDPSNGKCIARTYFAIQTRVSDLKVVGQKATGEVDINFTNFPTCQTKYRSCTNSDILTVVGKNIDSDAMESLQNLSETRHGDAIKVTCSNSSGLVNKDQVNFDSEAHAFRIFNCIHGTWSPSPSDLVCPSADCTDNEACGYPYE